MCHSRHQHHDQQLFVELRAEEERRFEQLVQFGPDGSKVAHPLGFQQDAERANHMEPCGLGQLHSELLDCLKLLLQFAALELEVRNTLF